MADRPGAAELAEAVREFLEAEVLPTVGDARLRFRVLVAANALAIAQSDPLLPDSAAPHRSCRDPAVRTARGRGRVSGVGVARAPCARRRSRPRAAECLRDVGAGRRHRRRTPRPSLFLPPGGASLVWL